MHPDDRDPTRYGRSFADVYDQWYVDAFDTDAAIATLTRLADGRSLLELGAGTGRLAIPLANDGVDVVALDSSTEMLERLRDRDTLGRVAMALGDMGDLTTLDGLSGREFDVIVCACSSILNLPDLGSIERCIGSAAGALSPGGNLVIESIVPADSASIPLRSLTPARVTSDGAVFVETTFDPSTMRLHGRHIEITGGSVTTRPWSVVLCDIESFDRFAIGAGLTLVDRWTDWTGSPFDDGSATHVSIWRRTS